MTYATLRECTADIDHPCDAGEPDEYGEPTPCAACVAFGAEARRDALRSWQVATLAERDPQRYAAEMRDAGRTGRR